jgi:4,5-dihydroxyphthalate decarboxylase
MTGIILKTVTRTQGNNRALKDGTVKPQRFSFDFEEVPVLVRAFRRMVRGLKFDVSEMAFTTYLCAKAHGKPFTALPVFLVRGFHHGAVVRGEDSDIRNPADLEGRKVGVNRGYTVTTGVWARAILREEYGLDPDRVTWMPSGDEHVAEYRPPANVVPMEQPADLVASVTAGDLAAAVGVTASQPGLVPVIPDTEEAGFAALAERGLYPINHLVVVRDDVLAAHPDLASDIFTAFAEAKNRYVDDLRHNRIDDPSSTDQMYRRVMEITEGDPLPYGIAPNRPMIERLIEHAVDQKILDRPLPMNELFAPGTHELTA